MAGVWVSSEYQGGNVQPWVCCWGGWAQAGHGMPHVAVCLPGTRKTGAGSGANSSNAPAGPPPSCSLLGAALQVAQQKLTAWPGCSTGP